MPRTVKLSNSLPSLLIPVHWSSSSKKRQAFFKPTLGLTKVDSLSHDGGCSKRDGHRTFFCSGSVLQDVLRPKR